jgi:hypothetical protein
MNVTGYGLLDWLLFLAEEGITLFATTSRLALELTQPPIQQALGTYSPELKQLEYEADSSPPT